MSRLRGLGTVPVTLCLAVWFICLSGLCESRGESMTVGAVKRDSTQKAGFGRRKNRNDCDELREMFIEQGCVQKDSRRCRILNFKLEGGRLSKRPRCDFMPCERYDQPTNQTCESFCFGTTIPGGLCEAGKTCCVQSKKPATQPPKTPCAFTCKSSWSCSRATTGSCPYSYDVCCADEKSQPFPYPAPSKTCAHQCVSAFDCLEVDSYSSCGQFSLDVCCRTVGGRGFYSQNTNGGVDNLLASHGLFPGGFGNFYSVFGSGSDPFNQGGGKTPPIPQPPKPKGNTEVQPLPCPYTCLAASACGDVDPASNVNTCGGSPYVCCRVALPPPVPTESGANRRGRKRKGQNVTPAPRKPGTSGTSSTTSTTTTTTRRTLPYTYPRFTVKPTPVTTTTTTTTTTTEMVGKQTVCPFECVRSNRCVEADSSFSCGNRKVCCRTKKKDGN
ncbi:hypothetical protein RRG08_063344 [Elysia crispata]|uniref:WAP domain-containing protein n=1 Tax=Elysia crispata TaxID=231223 RepID=A0AAE1E8K4_9GAST|nr:hypothetical protein RRG08_063344 [Elysia crispata]